LEQRSLAVSPPRDRSDRLPRRSVRRRTLQSAFVLGNGVARARYRLKRLIGDDGARPEVGWVPVAMDEPPAPRFSLAAPRNPSL